MPDAQLPLAIAMNADDTAAAATCALAGDAASQLSTPRQWLVLLVISLNYALNAELYMNTCAAGDAFSKLYQVDPDVVAPLFGVFLITAVVGMTPGMFWGIKAEGSAIGFSIAMNVGAAWLRYVSVMQESYGWCLLSTIAGGAGCWTILCLPAQVSQQRFKPSQWTLTTSMIVQSNYAGWLLGSIIPAQTMYDNASIKSACFVQAIVATPLVILFFVLYRPVSAEAIQLAAESRMEHSICSGSLARDSVSAGGTAGADAMGDGSFRQLFNVARKYPLFVVQVVSYGLIGGVSFAQPSASAAILNSYGFKDSLSSWVTVCFIAAGVIAGLVLGERCSEPLRFGAVLKALFVAAAVAIVITAVICKIGFVNADNTASFVVIMLLSAVAGATTLGFIGIAIEAAALYPVGAGYACWVVQALTYGIGGGMGFLVGNASGFIILAVMSTSGAVLVLLSYRHFGDERP